MGCCMVNSIEIKNHEILNQISSKNEESSEYIDLSISSDDEIAAKEFSDWKVFKGSASKSLTESVGMMSTLLHSERKISIYSKPGSFIEFVGLGSNQK